MVWLDVEDQILRTISSSTLVDIINSYGEVIENSGNEFGIYTGLSFYNELIKSYASKIKYPFWIARYPSSSQISLATPTNSVYKPVISNKLYGWQYSSKCKITGVPSLCDVDEWYSDVEALSVSTASLSDAQKHLIINLGSALAVSGTLDSVKVLAKTITVSSSNNKNSSSVTALERFLKELGYYKGSIEADSKKTPIFGSGMTKATILFQSKIVGLSKPDGEWASKSTSYKKALGTSANLV
jgi:hypothetical protein